MSVLPFDYFSYTYCYPFPSYWYVSLYNDSQYFNFFSEKDWYGLAKSIVQHFPSCPSLQTKNNELQTDKEKRLGARTPKPVCFSSEYKIIQTTFFLLYFSLQLFLPFRYLLYPHDLFWIEEGFRFYWQVMLIEKTVITFFTVKDHVLGKSIKINNQDYLTPLQEKMMSTQPDMILQFAHLLANTYQQKGFQASQVLVESYVSLNGRGSQLFINPNIDLAKEKESFAPKYWILVKK